ncbi:MAG: hypothetical protein ACI4P8_02840 [Akkermansia sp.]
MNTCPPTALTGVLCVLAAAPLTAADSHTETAQALIELLHATEASLARCRDADSIRTELPILRQLAEQAQALRQRQQALPEPTVQDFLAVQHLAPEFMQLSEHLGEHMQRLEEQGLMSPELRAVLQPPRGAQR